MYFKGGIMCYSWEKEFEIEFGDLFKQNNKEDNNKEDLKIIIGQSPYKQKINGKEFKVSSCKNPYCELGETVAFFVTDWIKIQDSLEMIFNLLFNGSINSLKVLSYLRENKIPADEFADYLYINHNLVLTNITINNKDCNIKRIESFIKDNNNKNIYLLLVGKKATKILNGQVDKYIKDFVEFIHPSGQNLNKPKCQQIYFNNWYSFKINNNSKNFIIKKFILF